MKLNILVFAVAVSAAAFGADEPIDAIYTVPHELDHLLKSGHIQGASCSESGIYLSHMLGIDKIDWKTGRVLAHADAPAHLGDCAYADGKVYGVFGLHQPIDGKRGMIRVWDENLKLLQEEIPVAEKLDGAEVFKDRLFSSPDVWGRDPHPGNKLMAFDLKTLAWEKTYDIDSGYQIYFGTQTMATDGRDVFLGNYGAPADQGNPNRYCCSVHAPDLKLVRNLEFGCAEGFGLVPQSVSKRETPVFFVVRALGGNMQEWRKDPEGNPPRIRIDFYEYANGEMKYVTRRDARKEKYEPSAKEKVEQRNERLQVVTYAAPSTEPIVYSAEVKAEAAAARDLCLWLDIHYADGSGHWGTGAAHKNCCDGTYGWRKVTGVFNPAKPVKKIEFNALFRGGMVRGKVEFRNMKIERRAAQPGEESSVEFWTDYPFTGEPRTVPGVRDDDTEVWTADSMDKVTPLTFPPSSHPKAIDLELCGRERESAQICITAGRLDGWTDGRIEIGELKRADGKAFPGTAKWERIGYIPREIGGITHSCGAPLTEKWLPDPLLPAAPFKVRAGSTQGVWLTFFAEADAAPGVYAGEIRVCRGKTVHTHVPVKLTVRGFSLPKTFSRNVSLSVMDGFTRLKYPQDFKNKKRESWDIMLDHRLSPDDISRFTLPDLDDLEYAKERGMNHFNILNIVPEPKDPNTPIVYTTTKEVLFSDWFYPQFRDRLVPYVAELKKRGLADMAYLYGFDEQEKEYFPAIEEFWRKLRKDVPGIPLMSTSKAYRDFAKDMNNPPPSYDAGDWFCPLSGDWDPKATEALRAKGKRIWWYTCLTPQEPYLNVASIEYPFADGRLLSWQTHLVGADGYLFWVVNFWNDRQKLMDEGDTYFPNWSLKIGNDVHGDGILLYPGEKHILPSIRLANIRDGIEDSEWMLMAGDCMDIVRKVTSDVKTYTRDTRIVRAARSAIGDVIEGVGKGLDLASDFDDPASFIAMKELRRWLNGVTGRVVLRKDAAFEAQAWRTAAEEGTLVITAKDGLGALYGALNFLERIGYRFFAPDCTVVPKDLKGAYSRFVPATGRTTVLEGRPAIRSRYFYMDGGREDDAMWALRNRCTCSPAGLANTEVTGSPRDNHTFEFYAEMIRREGEPRSKGFCLMNDDVRKRVAEAMKATIRADRAAFAGKPGYEIPTIYELSQNDGGNDFPCRCEKCLAAKEAAGSWSGPNIRFASAVAEEVAKEFPDVKVRTFAYSYTEKAPKDDFKAADNLIVRYCRSFVFQPLTAETPNGKGLADWDKCVNEKYAWGYWRSYSGPLFPLVKPRADIEGEFRFCRDIKVCGYFAEAERPYERAFSFLQAYLALKMMENPDHDVGKMSRAFMKAYYGKAEKPMEDYLSYLERREREEYAKIDPAFIASVNSGYLAMFTERGFLDDAFFATVDDFLTEAERAAQGDAQVSERIARERRIFENAKADRYVWRPEAIGQNGRERGHPQLLVKDPEARRGYAVCDAVGKVESDYTITLMDDWTGERSEFRLKPDEIPWNGPYRLYKVGSISLVCESWIGFNGASFYNWVPYFGHSTEKRDVWVSMKFKDGNVYYDGLWFVPVGDDPGAVKEGKP